jgi:cobalt/nickel transport system ATP-binding protein
MTTPLNNHGDKQALLSLRQLSFNHSSLFNTQRNLLDGIDLELFNGERLALLGGNGEGKTTLFHLIVGLLKKQKGEIVFEKQPFEGEKQFKQLRKDIGLLFQDPDDQLFCPTVIEDVAFGPLNLGQSRTQALETAHNTLKQLGLSDLSHRISHQLSGGEKRMVTLAGVLAMQPKVLLLDEPTNALDKQAKHTLINTLQTLDQAMIIISHDQTFIDQVCTRSLRLQSGKLIPPSKLNATNLSVA